MQRILIIILAMTTAGLLYGRLAPIQESEEDEARVSLQSVPEHVIEAALAAVEGVELTEAEVEAVLVYELEGTVDGREVEIEVTEDGEVIEVEEEDDDDDDEPSGN